MKTTFAAPLPPFCAFEPFDTIRSTAAIDQRLIARLPTVWRPVEALAQLRHRRQIIPCQLARELDRDRRQPGCDIHRAWDLNTRSERRIYAEEGQQTGGKGLGPVAKLVEEAIIDLLAWEDALEAFDGVGIGGARRAAGVACS